MTKKFAMALFTSFFREKWAKWKSLRMFPWKFCVTSLRKCWMKANEYRGPDSRRVQQMFAGIAHRYDFLNHFLSISIDRHWRNLAVAKVRELVSPGPSAICLDL